MSVALHRRAHSGGKGILALSFVCPFRGAVRARLRGGGVNRGHRETPVPPHSPPPPTLTATAAAFAAVLPD